MRRYDPGDTATLRHEVRNAAGALTAATVEFDITAPDGEAVTGLVVSNPSTGVYDMAVVDLDEGVYSFVWTVSGAVADVVPGKFYVADDDDRLPPLASFDQFARKIGYRPEGDEAERAYEVLDDASELIRDKAGKTWIVEATGGLEAVPRRVRSICIESAYRAFGNPEALTQRTIGDSSKSFDRRGREGGEAVYLTKAEEQAVRKAAANNSMVSVTLVSPYSTGTVADPWAQVTAE